ncbi:DEAD-box ATP-dependent RNA helicase CshA [Pirellula sp. SH-Sr6A]|uniref:DEAD/DEAH box helicase n=1 Tax=Pirellula sp. SH-Sr6A TaxID=1632865 RepID=UPI00078D0BAF|nr:DEAD/DEAH box helicase [Pirellula sp. SH-Sr6A]AMV34408.1 DEAD-box ATP-dependent RNA helicase CshA [Pirellula sp. SH-Sr6A]
MESKIAETFEELGLSPIMMRALAKLGYERPSPIQSRVIPWALEGYDLIGQARTGTGKTASFAIPILEQLDPLRVCPSPQALVLVPTRELAAQVHGEFVKLADGCPTEILEVAGGKHLDRQTRKLREGVQVVVGTPGRVIDHIQRGSLDLRRLWCVVLDEADRMLDIGFRPDIERILRRCPENRQTLLLSATLAAEVKELANRYLFEPVHIDCSNKDISVETIEQRYLTVAPEKKLETLLALLERERPPQTIIFCRTKLGTAKLHNQLERQLHRYPDLKHLRLATIHGNMNQSQRDAVFKQLREGSIQILVATDVVGRGIDVSTISHIINWDLPDDCSDYVHRVGRTGRMGREGIAFSFVAKGQGQMLTEIEHKINRLLVLDPLSENHATMSREVITPTVIRDEVEIGSAPESFGLVAHGATKKPRLNRMRRSLSDRERRR